MPQTACLHIQARESDPVRVVGLARGAVRIGRAAFCDVRLTEPDLADEECRLRKRGATWQIVPVDAKGSVWLEGEPVDRTRTLPFDVPFRVGGHWLTLKPTDDLAPEWSTPREAARAAMFAEAEPEPLEVVLAAEAGPESTRELVAPTARLAIEAPAAVVTPAAVVATAAPELGDVFETPESPEPAAAPEPTADGTTGTPHKDEWQARQARHDRMLHAHREARRWESRWRAVGEKVKASAAQATAAAPTAREPRRPEPPKPTERLKRAGVSREALRRAPEGTPVARVVPPSPAARVAPSVARVVPPSPAARVVPAVTPTAAPKIPRPVPKPAAVAPVFAPEPPPVAPEPMARVAPEPDRTSADVDGDLWDFELRDALRDAELDALEIGSPEPTPAPATELEPAPVAKLPPAPPAAVVEAVEEDEAEEDEEPAGRPVLGATRRVVLPEPVAPAAPLDAVGLVQALAGWDFANAAAPAAAEPAPSAGAFFATPPSEALFTTPPVEPVTASAAGERAPRRDRSVDPTARDWPTVRDILAAQGVRPRTATSTRTVRSKGSPRRPSPTVSHAPGQWRLPLWLGWLPAAALASGVSAGGLAAAWVWVNDGRVAGVVASRLADPRGGSKPLPEGYEPPSTWWRTTADNLVAWAAYSDRSDDPAVSGDAEGLLDRASQAAPLHPTVRFVKAKGTSAPGSKASVTLARSLGQTRDVASLSWSGRQLLDAGKGEAALRAFREALEMATTADLSRSPAPAFLEDAQTRRYALPNEDLIGSVVAAMADAPGWTYKDWSAALPAGTAAPVAAARLLRERGSADAGAALDACLSPEPGAPDGSPRAGCEAVRLAARAEALALKREWKEADVEYRRAIEIAPTDVIRRAWLVNVADLALRLDDETARLKALDAAKSDDPRDEITERVVEMQRAAGYASRGESGRPVGSRVAGSESRRVR